MLASSTCLQGIRMAHISGKTICILPESLCSIGILKFSHARYTYLIQRPRVIDTLHKHRGLYGRKWWSEALAPDTGPLGFIGESRQSDMGLATIFSFDYWRSQWRACEAGRLGLAECDWTLIHTTPSQDCQRQRESLPNSDGCVIRMIAVWRYNFTWHNVTHLGVQCQQPVHLWKTAIDSYRQSYICISQQRDRCKITYQYCSDDIIKRKTAASLCRNYYTCTCIMCMSDTYSIVISDRHHKNSY